MRRFVALLFVGAVGFAAGHLCARPAAHAPDSPLAQPFEVHESHWESPSHSFATCRPFRLRHNGVETELGPRPAPGTPTLTLVLRDGRTWVTAARE